MQDSMDKCRQSTDQSGANATKQMLVFTQLGEKWLANDELKKASVYYQKVIDLNPQFVPAYNRLGYILQEDGQLAESLAIYEQARECLFTIRFCDV